METFTLLPRRCWLVQAFVRSPLVRRSDRWEAALMLCLVLAVSVNASVAGAIGTAVYESRSRIYAEELRDRVLIPATVVAESSTSIDRLQVVDTAPVRWSHNGIERIDTVRVDATTKPDDPVDVWVDESGNLVDAPRATSWAGVDAALAGLIWWAAMTLAAGALWQTLRFLMARRRARGWDRELRALVDDPGGRTGRQS